MILWKPENLSFSLCNLLLFFHSHSSTVWMFPISQYHPSVQQHLRSESLWFLPLVTNLQPMPATPTYNPLLHIIHNTYLIHILCTNLGLKLKLALATCGCNWSSLKILKMYIIHTLFINLSHKLRVAHSTCACNICILINIIHVLFTTLGPKLRAFLAS